MNLTFNPRNGSGRDDQSHNGTAPLPEPIEEMGGLPTTYSLRNYGVRNIEFLHNGVAQ
jgi:hypothetical protein